MNLEKLEIKPLKGLNDIVFGTNMAKIKSLFGKADEEEQLNEEGDDEPETYLWNYHENAITVFFEKHEKETICTAFETYHEDATLFGKVVFDMEKDEIIELMKANDYDDIEEEEEEWGELRLSFNDALMDFYFEDNILSSISWGVEFDDEGEMMLPE